MVIKVRKRNGSGKFTQYRSVKKVLTPKDIREADRFSNALDKEIRKIEKILLKKKLVTPEARKSDMLDAWYLIGTRINSFLKIYKVSPEEEKIFWDHLYGRSSLIRETVPNSRISSTRNDFRIASLLANQPLSQVKKINLWALWREVITYRSFKDDRVLDWVVSKLKESPPKTRNEARPFLKAVAKRLKRIDTSVLSKDELSKKLNGFSPRPSE